MRFREKKRIERAGALIRQARTELGTALAEIRRADHPLEFTAVSDTRTVLEGLQELVGHTIEGTLAEYIAEAQEAVKAAEN